MFIKRWRCLWFWKGIFNYYLIFIFFLLLLLLLSYFITQGNDGQLGITSPPQDVLAPTPINSVCYCCCYSHYSCSHYYSCFLFLVLMIPFIFSFSFKKKHFSGKVKEIRGGFLHSAAITESGELFMWGAGQHGQLGLSLSLSLSLSVYVSNFFFLHRNGRWAEL